MEKATEAEPKVTDQQLLDSLKDYLREAPKACTDAQIAGMYALNFCKTPPFGFDINKSTYPSDLAAMQLSTINRCVASLNKNLQVDLELPNRLKQTITVLRFQSFETDRNAWKVLSSDGRNLAETTLDANQFIEELRLAD